MNIFDLVQFAVWYVVFAISVICLHHLFWPQKLSSIERFGCYIYLFVCWWFVFPFMVGQLRELMMGYDDE